MFAGFITKQIKKLFLLVFSLFLPSGAIQLEQAAD